MSRIHNTDLTYLHIQESTMILPSGSFVVCLLVEIVALLLVFLFITRSCPTTPKKRH
jgi:hypothetical protein